MRLAVGIGVLTLACVMSTANAIGAAPSLESRAMRIERQVWSPYCPGRLLAECTTEQAQQLRDRIRQRLSDGESDRDVYNWLRRNYGEEVLANPRASGAGLAVWMLPTAALLLALMAFMVAVRRWRRVPITDPASRPEDDFVRRVRDDVQKGP